MKPNYTPQVGKVGGLFFLFFVLAREQEMRCEIGFDRGFAPVELYGGPKREREQRCVVDYSTFRKAWCVPFLKSAGLEGKGGKDILLVLFVSALGGFIKTRRLRLIVLSNIYIRTSFPLLYDMCKPFLTGLWDIRRVPLSINFPHFLYFIISLQCSQYDSLLQCSVYPFDLGSALGNNMMFLLYVFSRSRVNRANEIQVRPTPPISHYYATLKRQYHPSPIPLSIVLSLTDLSTTPCTISYCNE